MYLYCFTFKIQPIPSYQDHLLGHLIIFSVFIIYQLVFHANIYYSDSPDRDIVLINNPSFL